MSVSKTRSGVSKSQPEFKRSTYEMTSRTLVNPDAAIADLVLIQCHFPRR